MNKFTSNSHSISNPIKQREDGGIRRLSFDSVSQSPMHDGVNSKEGLNDVLDVGLANSSSPCKQCTEDEVEIVGNDPIDIVLGHKKTTPASSTELHKCNTDVSESPPKDILSSASPRQVEESPATLHEKNAKKVKSQSKIDTTTSQFVVPEENQTTSQENKDKERKRKKSEWHRRQSLAGAGTLWKSGVRRSTRIRSRPLEYWRGERFLYGRIHHSLTTVIGIKYSSPLPNRHKKDAIPKLKVKSYVDEQYSHLVEFAASH